MAPNKVLGCSNKATTLRNEGWRFVFKTFISFIFKEKKAISLPAIKKESRNNIARAKDSMAIAVGVKATNRFKKVL